MPRKAAGTAQARLVAENADLRARLDEAEETLGAIRSGGADALIVSGNGGDQVFALEGADRSYRLLIEAMNEGALIVTPEGLISYANRRLAEMLKTPLEKVIASDLRTWIAPDGHGDLQALLKDDGAEYYGQELALRASDGTQVPVYLSASKLPGNGSPHSFGLVAADLTDQHKRKVELSAAAAAARETLAASNQSRLALLSVAEDQKEAEESLVARTLEVSKLYELSRALASADSMAEALDIVNLHAVDALDVTFARIALVDGHELVTRAAYPIRVLEHDLAVGDRTPTAALPHCQRALKDHEPVLLRAGDPGIEGGERQSLLLDFTQSLCLIPLWVGEATQESRETLGLLMLGEARGEERAPFTPEKIRTAQNIGAQAATTIRRMLLREQTDRRLRHVAALHAVDNAISGSFDLRTVLGVALEQITTHLGVDAAAFLLLDPHTLSLDHVAARGFRSDAITRAHVRLGESYAGRSALERQLIQILDVRDKPADLSMRALLTGDDFVSYFCVPLIAKGQVRGVLELFHRAVLQPDAEWLDFLNALAGQAAIALENSELFEGLQRSNVELTLAYDATIEGWSHALDLRDQETEGHTQRVAELTLKLARDFGFSGADLMQIRWGALLHDIGKMGVPDGILLKPGPLTDEEWVTMKKHPTFAHDMLAPIGYLRLALDIPYCHHEKWDGTGYPRGLKGEQIPMPARAFAVVDVWDALTSDRPYRKAWSRPDALEYIRAQSGKHFDPRVVDAFINLDRT
ncbi:MAG: HD domain-containing phosphohydrolase [Chloroflexota bacterium]